MGNWYTIHLFDYEKYKQKGFHDLMRNKNEFKIICQQFLELTPFLEHGKSLPYEEKIKKIDSLYHEFNIIIKEFATDLSLKNLIEYENEDAREDYMISVYDYDFARFFNFLLFFEYADYYPFVSEGKHGVSSKFRDNNSLGNELLIKLDPGIGNNYFSIEGYGIVGWLTAKEVKLLEMDLDKLSPEQNTNTTGFFNLVRIAERENLGIILGVDMIDDKILDKLPKTIMDFQTIDKSGIEGLCFEK